MNELDQQGDENFLLREEEETLVKPLLGAVWSTSDVAQAQLVEGQDDGGGLGLPRSHTLLPGQVVLPRVPHKLDAFWDRNLHMDL